MFIAESPQRNLFNHAGSGYGLGIKRVHAPGLALEGRGWALELVTALKFILVFRKAAVYTCTSCHLFEIFVGEFGELFVLFVVSCFHILFRF